MSERKPSEVEIEYHRPPPDDYDAIKAFREGLGLLEHRLGIATSERVKVKSIVLEQHWELWHKMTEELE